MDYVAGSSTARRILIVLAIVGAPTLWWRLRPAAPTPASAPVSDRVERRLERLRKRGPLTDEDLRRVAQLARGLQAASAAPPEPEPSPPQQTALDRAEALFREGVSRFRDGDHELAAELFLEAYEEVRAPLLIYNASVALEKMGRCQESLEVMRWYLDENPAEISERDRERLARLESSC